MTIGAQLQYSIETRGGVLYPVETGRGERTTGRVRRTGTGGCVDGTRLQPLLTDAQRDALNEAAANLTGRLHATTKQKYPVRLKAQDVLRACLARAEGDTDLEELISAELRVMAVEGAAARHTDEINASPLSFDTSPTVHAAVMAMAVRAGAYHGNRPAPSRLVAAIASLWLRYPTVWEAAFGGGDVAGVCDLARQDQTGRTRTATDALRGAA